MTKKKATYVIPSPTEQLPKLWKSGFFKVERTLSDVLEEFTRLEYNFGKNPTSMALTRCPFLTQRGKKGSYVYIQIGPYAERSE